MLNKQYITTAFTTVDARSSHLGFQSQGCEILPTRVSDFMGRSQLQFSTGNSEIPTSESKWNSALASCSGIPTGREWGSNPEPIQLEGRRSLFMWWKCVNTGVSTGILLSFKPIQYIQYIRLIEDKLTILMQCATERYMCVLVRSFFFSFLAVKIIKQKCPTHTKFSTLDASAVPWLYSGRAAVS